MTYEYTVYRPPLPNDGKYVQQYAWVHQALASLGWNVRGLDPNLYSVTAERTGLTLIQQRTDSGSVWALSEMNHPSEGYIVYMIHKSYVLNEVRFEEVLLVGDHRAVEAAIHDLGWDV